MLRVALCQLNGTTGKTGSNIDLIGSTIQERSSQEIDLFCFPELFREGYNCSKDQFIHLAEKADGPDSKKIREYAKRYKVYIAFGYAEKGENGEIYNSSQLINPKGVLLVNYRKTHLYDPDMKHERTIFTPGSEFSPIVDVKGIPCALLICWDVEIPEICRVLAIRGTKCFIVLTANYSNLTNIVTVRSRAIENNAFVIYNNFSCKIDPDHFCGLSVAYAPDGEILVMASESKEEVCVAEIDTQAEKYNQFIRCNPLLKDRRPELYSDICN